MPPRRRRHLVSYEISSPNFSRFPALDKRASTPKYLHHAHANRFSNHKGKRVIPSFAGDPASPADTNARGSESKLDLFWLDGSGFVVIKSPPSPIVRSHRLLRSFSTPRGAVSSSLFRETPQKSRKMGEEKLSDVPLSPQSPPMDLKPKPAGNDVAAGEVTCINGEVDETVGEVAYLNDKIAGEAETDSSISDEDVEKHIKEQEDKLAPGRGSDSSISGDDEEITDQDLKLVRPAAHLPQPEAPPGLTRDRSTGPEDQSHLNRSVSASAGMAAVDVSAIGKYIRDRGNSFSAAIVKRISSLKEGIDGDGGVAAAAAADRPATEFNISGLKVIVRVKDDRIDGIKGRISFFSRSGCRDCGAVRSFFREQNLPYVEINVDVFPEREAELVQRTGSAAVPAIFFNEKLLGGLVALNSLRNSGEFERRLREMAGRRCPEVAPRVPVYGFDCEEGEWRMDEMVAVVRVVRQRLPIQDRLMKMKIIRNCFSGSDMVEALIQQLDCGRKKAVEVGKELARKHFIHHVFRENDFEDGHNQFYRFLEHDPAIPKCFNFRGSTNDDEPKSAAEVSQRLTKLMSAILEAFATDNRRRLDYARISSSEEFRRYVNLVQDLQRVDIFALSQEEKTAFFLNLYNAMVIHAIIRIGRPAPIDRRAFFSDFQYIVGGYHYSLTTIKNGILRSNRRQPYSLIRPFSANDRRLEASLPKLNPLIHFGLCNATRSSPTVRFFSAQGVDLELRYAAREFFLGSGIEVDLERRNVHLTRIIKWYAADFGQDKDILKWILNYLDATKAGLLTHLLNDGGPINIVYQNFDWSLNS